MPVTGPIGGRYHTTLAVVCLSLDPGQAEKTAPNGGDGAKIKDLRKERERKGEEISGPIKTDGGSDGSGWEMGDVCYSRTAPCRSCRYLSSMTRAIRAGERSTWGEVGEGRRKESSQEREKELGLMRANSSSSSES